MFHVKHFPSGVDEHKKRVDDNPFSFAFVVGWTVVYLAFLAN